MTDTKLCREIVARMRELGVPDAVLDDINAWILRVEHETPEQYMQREGWQYMGSASDDC